MVLLVEDQKEVRALASDALRRHGYVVLAAAGPTEALHFVREHGASIDLLLTDIVMPLMGGRQLAQVCRSHFPKMRVLYMSGHATDAVAQRAAAEDGLAFLQKPFSARSLLEKVRSILDAQTLPTF